MNYLIQKGHSLTQNQNCFTVKCLLNCSDVYHKNGLFAIHEDQKIVIKHGNNVFDIDFEKKYNKFFVYKKHLLKYNIEYDFIFNFSKFHEDSLINLDIKRTTVFVSLCGWLYNHWYDGPLVLFKDLKSIIAGFGVCGPGSIKLNKKYYDKSYKLGNFDYFKNIRLSIAHSIYEKFKKDTKFAVYDITKTTKISLIILKQSLNIKFVYLLNSKEILEYIRPLSKRLNFEICYINSNLKYIDLELVLNHVPKNILNSLDSNLN
jgi:hypothetical protein